MEYKTIDELGEIITGKTPSTSQKELWDGDTPFLTPSDYSYSDRYIHETERSISKKGVESQVKTYLPKDAVCVTCIGSTVGKSCMTVCPTITNQQINSIICNDNYDAHYVFYLMKYCLPFLQMYGAGTGSGLPIISKNKFGRIRLSVFADKEYQRQISYVLSKYDDLIDNNTKRIKILEQMVENLYKEWFVRFRFPGYEDIELKNGIPSVWEYKRADELIFFNPTLTVKDQEQFKIIPMDALSTTSMVINDESCYLQEKISGRRSQNGDTLLAKITPCLENGKTGFVMGLMNDEVAGGSTEFIVLRSKAVNPFYVYCLARSEYFRQTAIMSMNGADGRQRVNEDKLKALKVICPTKDILCKFEDVVSKIFREINILMKKNDNLKVQRDILLPRLMSGKLQVK